MQASWNFCLIVSFLVCWACRRRIFTIPLGLFIPLRVYPMVLYQEDAYAKVFSLEAQGSEFAVYPQCFKYLQPHHLKVTAAQPALELHVSCQPLLLMRTKSIIAPPLYPERRKLSPTNSKNLQDCLCPAVLSLQQPSGWLKSSNGTTACDYEAAPVYRGLHLLSCPRWVASSAIRSLVPALL